MIFVSLVFMHTEIPSIRIFTKQQLVHKRVLLRIDANVPVKNGRVQEDWRLLSVLPTIKFLQEKGAKIILLSHLGRPEGKVVPNLSLAPIAKHLAKLLGKSVRFVPVVTGLLVEDAVSSMKSGEVLMLENLRFDPGEDVGDRAFAKQLASYGDVYVNDGFAVCHRAAASVSVLPKYLPHAAGFLLEREILELNVLLQKPKRPVFVIIGGAKVDTKIGVIKVLAEKASALALGGSLSIPFLKASGYSVGASPCRDEDLLIAKKMLRLNNLLLPVDVVVAKNAQAKSHIALVTEVKSDECIFDLGSETLELFAEHTKKAKTIVWNGPLGMFEQKPFNKGTETCAKLVAAASKHAHTVCGGGETVEAIRDLHLLKRIGWVSTGGGAMLEFLEGKKLPGIVSLC